jgi:hypothetical protein
MTSLLKILTASAMVLGSTALVHAQTKPTNPNNLPPGQAMQDNMKPTSSPGASSFTPGHQMKQGNSTSPGASGYAPGHAPSTTGSTSSPKR